MTQKEQAPVAPTTTTTTTTANSAPPPTVKVNRRSIEINHAYLKSPPGFLRLALILFYLGGWISAASIPKSIYGKIISLPYNYEEVRSAYLFFSIVGFVGSIILYLFVLLKLVHQDVVNKLPWVLMTFISDALWSVPLLVISIICAVKETEFRNTYYNSSYFNTYQLFVPINIGAFAAAAFFGFACVILLILDGIFHFIRLIRTGFLSNYP